MSSNILRSAIAAVAGIVIAFGLIWLAQYAGSELSPDVYDPQTGEVLIPVGSTVALLVGWFVGTFAGGWVAMRVSGGTGAGWIVAGAVIGAGVYRAVTLADAWWIILLGILIPLAAAWAAQRATAVAAP
ncbi:MULTISPECIES: hypothetical protein [Sphingopyxis]|uniref:Uncharacterized protein n=1 Tax=Sphingopyxis granuli TaxID=267128 RepID=A0AA86L3P8_9SPHN|nr:MULTISPECIES: hypothetical protein [Sphingopyxis]AMG74693.1 Uncharacterized protein SGRAN_2328 [Sphingopyxis granuli]ODU27905.1 MAG: hypothetical protein ABS88_14850 [Sphingopyxis sp. SCN 67-31]